MENKNDKNKKMTFWEVLKDKQYRAIIYLAFYFIIFIVLIVMVRIDSSNLSNRQDDNVSQQEVVQGFSKIKEKNYNFKYTLNMNNVEYIYEGKQYNDKLLFIYSLDNSNYYAREGVYLKEKNKEYVLSENPFKYFDISDISILEKVLDKCKLKDDKYLIGINEFIKIIESDVELEKEDNIEITLTKQNGIITGIDMDITNFAKLLGDTAEKVKITMEYSYFGLIENFEIK